ncbi:acyl-CoA thioester hydrolase [Deinococcus reticulitermitis]|uniref:Acyl-CoA thioester hydrolase n=1 Tax=Deinococcus reticulitermitis TaxID=856736 RepID=A0A1H6WQG3_9DEIO|nr:thioesterase family protein [Deinococcus reticulitermitis]SEJ14980.1 acyl-CoA thioester hydrolase [Deinococcus reticulitermitis]
MSAGELQGEVQSELRVRYAETDAMGVVHHAVYPVWFEVGRSDLMRGLGLPYSEVEARGYYLMLSGLQVQYRRAARYDDLLRLSTRVSELRSRTARFAYELRRISDGSGELLASGETHHIATDHSYRPVRMPEDMLALLRGEGQRVP